MSIFKIWLLILYLMVSVDELRVFGREVKARLGLRTYPIGIKFCIEPCDLSGFKRPRDFGVHMAVCQVINISRVYGWPMAFTLDDMFCIGGAYLFGLVPEYPKFLEESPDWHTSSADAKKYIQQKYLERALPQGSTKAVLVAPLEKITFMPDVIDIYGTPTQISAIAKALIWHGIFPETGFIGLSSCSFITNAHKTRKPQINLPSSGEVAWGRTEEDEISMIIPVEHVDKILSGLDGISRIYPYPVPKFAFYEPRPPRGYKITYKDYEEWKKHT
jgi:uncharacterized protein (DUF169 family)